MEYFVWISFQSEAPKCRKRKNGKCAKFLVSISWPNFNGFKLSIHNLKALTMPVKMQYCKLKYMQVWQQDGLINVGLMVHEMAILFCYCLRPFWVRDSKIKISRNGFRSISLPNLDGFLISMCHFKVHDIPVNLTYSTPESIQIWLRNQAKTVRKLVRRIFQTPLGNLNFLKPVTVLDVIF